MIRVLQNIKGLCLYTTLNKKQILFYLRAATIFSFVFIDDDAGKHVNITYWYDKDNMYYFLKSTFFLISQIPNRGSHTCLYR